MDLKVSEKEFQELSLKATTLDYIEEFLGDLTEGQRNYHTTGELADLLLKLIEHTREHSECTDNFRTWIKGVRE